MNFKEGAEFGLDIWQMLNGKEPPQRPSGPPKMKQCPHCYLEEGEKHLTRKVYRCGACREQTFCENEGCAERGFFNDPKCPNCGATARSEWVTGQITGNIA